MYKIVDYKRVGRVTKLIVANWKMNGSITKITQDLEAYAKSPLTNKTGVVLGLPHVFLEHAGQTNRKCGAVFSLASQDISQFAGTGAYTGEVSGAMLRELGVKYAIIGHSERRTYFNESGSILQHKIENAYANQIIPIFCIGEDKTIRDNNNYAEFLVQQLELLLQIKTNINEIVIAYEPIWSIGTGVVPALDQISEIIKLIHAFVQSYLPHAKITALYGGSVSESNAQDILRLDQVGGVLVGGASLKVNDFTGICSY